MILEALTLNLERRAALFHPLRRPPSVGGHPLSTRIRLPLGITRGRRSAPQPCSGCASVSRRPGVGEFLPARRAFPEIQVDQRLIANACLLRQAPEVLNRVSVKPNRHLLLQTPGIGIAFGVGEVVVLPHFVHLAS